MQRSRVIHAVLSIAVGAGVAVATDAMATDFTDRDLLIGTFSMDEEAPLAGAQAELAAAQSDLTTAQAALDAANAATPADPAAIAAAEADVAAKQGVVDAKLAAVQAIEGELAETAALVGQLSEKQVHALNAALQNARKAGLLPLDLDAEYLQQILDGGWGMPEIAALTHAYEAEARFDRLSLRFVERFEEGGNAHFAEQAERFAARGDEQAARFLGKVAAQDARSEAREAAHEAHQLAAEEHSNGLAKGKGH
jgi:hypothetical protein